MLRLLRLKDFVIVDSAEIEFGAGFTALTGETGAGKSILLDALGLALGARGDAAMVREGAARADISAEFAIGADARAVAAAERPGGRPGRAAAQEDSGGRRPLARADQRAPQRPSACCARSGQQLVDIHGQHESQTLMRPGAQRELLDRFGKLEPQVAAIAASVRAMAAGRQGARAGAQPARGSSRSAPSACAGSSTRSNSCASRDGEWEELSNEQKRLAHAKDLIEGADAASLALSKGDGAITETLASLQHRLRTLSAIDASLAPVADLIDSASIQLDEAGSELAGYVQRMDLDPERLAEVENRVGAVFATARKLKLPPERLFEHQEQLRAEYAQLRAQPGPRGAGGGLAAAHRKAYEEQAAALTAGAPRGGRPAGQGRDASRSAAWAWPSRACWSRASRRRPGPAGSRRGRIPDRRPRRRHAAADRQGRLRRRAVAAGLAITVLAAQANPVPTLIFDEADAGIGGSVAAVVGELMQRLAGDCQVFCVTHLPQVASRADHHLKVSKTSRAAGPGKKRRRGHQQQRRGAGGRAAPGRDRPDAGRQAHHRDHPGACAGDDRGQPPRARRDRQPQPACRSGEPAAARFLRHVAASRSCSGFPRYPALLPSGCPAPSSASTAPRTAWPADAPAATVARRATRSAPSHGDRHCNHHPPSRSDDGSGGGGCRGRGLFVVEPSADEGRSGTAAPEAGAQPRSKREERSRSLGRSPTWTRQGRAPGRSPKATLRMRSEPRSGIALASAIP